MILQHLGRDGVAALIRRHIDLARRLAAAVDAAPDLERIALGDLSVVCFRFAPPGWAGDAARLDSLNKLLVERIQAEGRTFLTGTVLRGRFALRACVLHYGTTETDVDALIEIVREDGRPPRRASPDAPGGSGGRAAPLSRPARERVARRTSPPSRPVLNHRTRWADDPWVNDSGTT